MCDRDCEHLIKMTSDEAPDFIFNYCPLCGEYLGLNPVEEEGFSSFVVGSA